MLETEADPVHLKKEGKQKLPDGDPPVTLEDILDSKEWYPVFYTFIKDCLEENADSEFNAKLMKACITIFDKDILEADKEGWTLLLVNMNKECKEALDGIVQDFPKHVQVNQRLQTLSASRREETGHFNCECHKALNNARNIIKAQETENLQEKW